MAEYEVDGIIYEFPDDFSVEKVIGILREQNIIPPPAPEPAPTPTEDLRGLQELPAAEVEPIGALSTPLSVEKVVQEAIEATRTGRAGRTPEQQAQLEELARMQAERQARALVTPGGRVDLPSLEPEEKGYLQRAYEYLFPESKESIDQLLSRQPTMTAEALALAQEKAREEGKPYVEYLPDALRLSIAGVETPLGATVRVVGDTIAGAAEVAVREALTYETDPATGLPLDPEDLSYRAEQKLRELIGDENYPSTLASGGVLGLGPVGRVVEGLTGFDIGEAPRDMLVDMGVPEIISGYLTEGITVPTFGPIDHGSEAAKESDPYGFRMVDPNRDLDNWSDWTDQVIRNATVSRTLKDLAVDMPELREAYAETYGSESAAYYTGALADLIIPDLTIVGGKVTKGGKTLGGAVLGGIDAGLAAIAANRTLGSRVALEALQSGVRRGEGIIDATGDIVAREAVGPRALVDAVDIAGEQAGDLVRLAERVAPGSRSAKWVAERAQQVGLDDAFREMRIAQGAGDVQRVFEAAYRGVKAGEDGLAAGRQAAITAARALGAGRVPASMEAAIQGASTAREVAKAIDAVVPASSSVLRVGAPGSGPALRAILNKADELIEAGSSVTRGKKADGVVESAADAARSEVAQLTRNALGEMVPRDMVAVTSKVMVPRRVADGLRRLVDKDLRGTIETSGTGFKVVEGKVDDVVAAIERVYPSNLRGEFWDDMIDAVQEGRVLRADQTSRLTDALKTDAYLRLAKDPKTGRAIAERLANVGRELSAATGTTIQRVWSRNIGSRLAGAFGQATGAPAAYKELGRLVGRETFGIPKRVADALKAARKAGDEDPFKTVARDLADEAGPMRDKFIQEAWNNILGPLYGPLAGTIAKDKDVIPFLKDPPSLEALRLVDDAARAGEGGKQLRQIKDFGSALANGFFEAEAWVTTRRVVRDFLEDNPGMDLSLSPGLRGLDSDAAKAQISRAISDIMAQGTTYARAPGLGSVFDPDSPMFEYQQVLNSVGEALRAYGVKYLDEGLSGEQIAARIVRNPDSWIQSPELSNAILLIPQADTVLKKIQDLDGLKTLAEAATVVSRAKKDEGIMQTFTSMFDYLTDFSRAFVDLVVMNEPTMLVKSLFGPPIAVLAKQGAAKAAETLFPVAKSLTGETAEFVRGSKIPFTDIRPFERIPRIGKTLDDPLFEAGGRQWTQRAINDEIARLGVGASTRLSAARRGRLTADLMANLGVVMEGNKALGLAQRGAQYASRFVRLGQSIVDKVEQAFRREVFTIALREGRSADEAATIARDAVLDFEFGGTDRAARLLQPVIATAAEAVAGIEQMLVRPQETMRILRAMRLKQDYVQRTYGSEQELTGFDIPIVGRVGLFGPSAVGYTANLVADAYYKRADPEIALDMGKAFAGGMNPARALGLVSGGIQTWIEGEPTELTKEDEMLQVMIMASLADRYASDPTGLTPLQPWDVLVERYGLEATNIDPETGNRTRIAVGRPARFGKSPAETVEDIPAYYSYKMSPEGRKRFKADMARADQLGASPLLEAYKMYGMMPEIGMATEGLTEQQVAERRMGEEVRRATGRRATGR